MRYFWYSCLGLVLILAMAVQQSWIRIPPNWLPWGEADLEQKPTWLARIQIDGLSISPKACIAALDRSKLVYRRIAERPIEDGCGLESAVRLARSQIAYNRSFVSTCALTAALYWYERSLDRAAVKTLHAHVTRIDHVGSYACRNVNGGHNGRRSQHATANAIDVTGFHLSDGRLVTVSRDWGKGTDEDKFLHEAHRRACRFFNGVLGPDYNALHTTHFHLDLGPYWICR